MGTRHELHRVRRLLRPRTVRGHRAALPHRRLQTLRQTVPDSARTEELTDLVVWLGELVRQVDSSPLDEWEALRAGTDEHGAPVLPPTPSGVTANERAFRVLVRHAAFRRV